MRLPYSMAAPSGALRLRTRLAAPRMGSAWSRERSEGGGLLALLALLGQEAAAEAPKVEVYARSRAEEGKANTLHCFVSGFHPPKIDIELLKNGEPLPDVQYGDLSFNDKWQFQRLVHAPFIPTRGDIFVCRVAHSTMPEPRSYRWEPDF
ncbi:PREDICTED: beta-2-microglobulin [Ficedula albicollis]|uniref:beta-2-microglobulin n=1 Tax=Ficedula albicollis TaxID=59894 RepID=UPI0007AD7E22|nr:PREDICTED: beta-2-microglobulin [Ficedula albicollis]